MGRWCPRFSGQLANIYIQAHWGDCHLEREVLVAKGPNSGIYLMGEYEIQVLDSYGKKKIGAGDMGGIYGASSARVNASEKPGTWQKYVIDFVAPRFDNAGRKINSDKIALNFELNKAKVCGSIFLDVIE